MQELESLDRIMADDPNMAVVWLHGLGANGHDFQNIPEHLNLPEGLRAHFCFPHAATQKVTINQGFAMPAWYDIYDLSLDAKEDKAGIEAGMQAIEALIARKFPLLPRNRILLAGFSQGGALAVHTLLHSQHHYAGVIALSTYLPLRKQLQAGPKPDLSEQHIFVGHGDLDDVLKPQAGEILRDELAALGAQVEWRNYPIAHNLCVQELADIRSWILKRMGV
jgi:phospholipase/carboxylesterase|tara:strand:+ start:52531 stop:53196 length:666 start_codon:yes stop_codon:yes gene_type:complete